VRWVELPAWERRALLARVHPRLREDCLIAAGRSILELRPEIDAQRSKEDRVRVVLRHFGDEGHLNPDPENPPKHGPGINGNIAAHNCPPWERLPSLDEAPPAEQPKPRHRPPDRIASGTVKQLKWELAQRKTRRDDREFTQEKIAGRLELDRTRIQQAEALERVGWDLLRSHPEFSARDEFVRWPSAREAARLLASERAEN
jgi:hypothetical protein